MSENLRLYTKALYTLDAVAKRVPAEAWDNPSPCEGWTAREVAGHVSWVIQATDAAATGGEGPAEQPEAEVAGADPAATIAESVDGVLASLDRPGVLNAVKATPFGEMPVDTFIGIIWVDPLTHAWDIATAAGIDPAIDDETAAKAQATLEPIADVLRGPGRFADAKEPAADDALSRFIAFAGRTA
jgi:uncharacterized protein (TIGR03086 family)